MNLILKPPKTKRLKLIYDDVHSNFAFNINLRRYVLVQHPRHQGCQRRR